MNLLCVGVNHRVATVDVRERLAVSLHSMPQVLSDLLGNVDAVSEAVILSTCNRVEFYLACSSPALAFRGLQTWISNRTASEPPFYHYDTFATISHLFRVSAGLDSMVLGETEIFGQVKKAYLTASASGATSKCLNKLFQQSFRVAKRIRTETQITAGATSIGSVAVDLAQKIFGDLNGRHIMILGAGEISEHTAKSLQSRGIQSVIVSNRSFERARHLAKEIGGRAIHFSDWHEAFYEVDILISATSAPHAILTPEKLLPLMQKRQHRPLFIIDLAVPRDADPALDKLKGVFLYDIDSLQEIAKQGMSARRQELGLCENMIAEASADFMHWFDAQSSGFQTKHQYEVIAG
ncbi:MAG: glutamyl-tRNA reductase [Chthoniobacterales bacterium]